MSFSVRQNRPPSFLENSMDGKRNFVTDIFVNATSYCENFIKIVSFNDENRQNVLFFHFSPTVDPNQTE